MKNIPPQFLDNLQVLHKEFTWDGKRPKVKHSTLIGNYEEGGFKVVDLPSKFKSLKIISGFVRLRENLENLEKGTFWKKIRENLENSGNFVTIFTTSGKTQRILFCQISLPSSLGHLANILPTGTLSNPVTAF